MDAETAALRKSAPSEPQPSQPLWTTQAPTTAQRVVVARAETTGPSTEPSRPPRGRPTTPARRCPLARARSAPRTQVWVPPSAPCRPASRGSEGVATEPSNSRRIRDPTLPSARPPPRSRREARGDEAAPASLDDRRQVQARKPMPTRPAPPTRSLPRSLWLGWQDAKGSCACPWSLPRADGPRVRGSLRGRSLSPAAAQRSPTTSGRPRRRGALRPREPWRWRGVGAHQRVRKTLPRGRNRFGRAQDPRQRSPPRGCAAPGAALCRSPDSTQGRARPPAAR